MKYETPRVVEVGKTEDVIHGPSGGGVDLIGPFQDLDSTE
jgi:hypothetical protein